MKLEYTESKHGMEISLEPETIAEVAQLLRFANNAKADKPSIYLTFNSDRPFLNLWLKKKAEKAQYNSIRPFTT